VNMNMNSMFISEKQTTLDLFSVSLESLKQHIGDETDKKRLSQINKKALWAVQLTKTRLRSLRFD
jgi:hypothetical protein